MACTLDASMRGGNPSPPSDWFHGVTHQWNGEFLVITYMIDYPGMTKVKLYSDSKDLLWSNQYVNDEEGKHELRVKAGILTPGRYVFEFDYKNHREEYPIVR
jgi:hypothetical protein